ncbi:MAG: IS200/IS605 family transposase [Schleiferilactobacillus perolens]|uniref:IS200/IS605 family transposase n=1 Tax=Schleiferilactobacillus perolens TaxID=100468 RepID=UPI0039ECCCA2
MTTNKTIPDAVYTRRYVYNFHFHLIWATKYRHPLFADSVLAEEMKGLLRAVAADNSITIEQIEVMPDHIDLLLSFPPRMSAVQVIQILKGRSGFLFLQNHPEIRQAKFWSGHLWSPSYYMNTLGNMNKATAERYINDQKYNAEN